MRLRTNECTLWCRDEAHFLKLRSLMEDDNWPLTYAEWLENAEKYLAEKQRAGLIITKIYAEPDAFAAFVRLRAIKADARARILYAVVEFSKLRKSNN